jgi:hypothetical protein
VERARLAHVDFAPTNPPESPPAAGSRR